MTTMLAKPLISNGGDYSVDFNMSDIQEVDSPLAMIDAL